MPVSPGDKLNIRAADWNGLLDVLRWFKKTGGVEGLAALAAKLKHRVVEIKNTTGSDVSAFGVLAIDSPIIPITANAGVRFNGVQFNGVTPNAGDHEGKFAVLLEPATANGGFARAVMAGETLAKLNVVEESDTHCEIEDGKTTYLTTSGRGSAEILWKEGGLGGKWALIRIGSHSSDLTRFRLNAALSNGGFATARILTFDGTDYNAGTTDIYVFDWYAVATGLSTRGMFQGVSGMEGYAAKRETPSVAGHEEYDIIWMEQYAWDCEVTLTANPTFSGTAYESAWSATATVDKSFHQGVSPGSSITVYDDQGMYPFAKSGALAKVIRTEYEGSAPYYKIVVCQQLALTARATLSGALCASSTATVAGFTVTSPSPFNLNLAPTTVYNPRGHAGLHGDDVWLSFNKSGALYEITDMELHGVGMLTSLRQSGAWLQFGYKSIFTELCSNDVYYINGMAMKFFNWWCSGSYYQYCSGADNSGSGSGSGSTGATCDCTTLASTLTLYISAAGTCLHGQTVTLTKSGSTWSFSGNIQGDAWAFSWACTASGGVLGGVLTVTYPACITATPASPAALNPTTSPSCSPPMITFDSLVYSAFTGCSVCTNTTASGSIEFFITA